MAPSQRKHASLSEVDPEFAPLIPAVNQAFKEIWTFDDMTEFRSHWTKTRSTYPEYVPVDGFDLTHQMVATSDGTEIEIRVWTPTNAGSGKLPLLFVLHGGGWVVGGHDSENAMSRSVCVKNQTVVLSVDYRRAPEHKFPTALNDGYDVYKWTLENADQLGIDRDRILLGGTSSGANLTAALALRLRDEGALHGVLGQLLNIPVLCHPQQFPHGEYELNSYEQNADSPTINGKHMIWFWGNLPALSLIVTASQANLYQNNIIPKLDQTPWPVAGLDPLRDEGIAYADVLKKAGVDATLKIYPGLPHGFVLAVKMDVARRYYSSMVEWVAARLEG
ncbi:MAG: hypothetical protein M1818_002996 [Claussenomyces sp. TS43310]|nr:MAG: hypothetical protein M1818_002996 [Claussenomyces sp. TS43310]